MHAEMAVMLRVLSIQVARRHDLRDDRLHRRCAAVGVQLMRLAACMLRVRTPFLYEAESCLLLVDSDMDLICSRSNESYSLLREMSMLTDLSGWAGSNPCAGL